MATFIETTDAGFNLQLKNFASKISTYSATLALSAADVSSVKADSVAFDYIMGNLIATQTFAQNYTAFKNQLRYGAASVLGALPPQPTFTPPPVMPLPDVEIRFRNLVQRIVHQPNYTNAMGEDLGIVKPQSAFRAADGKPVFNIELSSGGHPNLRWTKGKYDGVEIWKDNGTGYVKLERDMRPDYIDKSDLPAEGIAAAWKYKMIYLQNDEVVGNWSDEVAVTVYGAV
jgi:hypothetical protein